MILGNRQRKKGSNYSTCYRRLGYSESKFGRWPSTGLPHTSESRS